MKKWMMSLAVVGCLVAAPMALATPLPAGGVLTAAPPFPVSATSYSGESFATLVSGGLSFVNSMSSHFSGSDGAGHTIAGTLESAVWKDGSGKLSFFYRVVSDPKVGSVPSDGVQHLTVGGFAGLTIYNANYLNDAWLVGDLWQILSRTVDGDVVDAFSFPPGIAPGTSSDWLMFQTDATSYGKGVGFLQDHAQASADCFTPAPLPSSLVLFSTGILGFAGGLFRRMRRGLTAQL